METCPDDHHCLNGSKCVENPYREGSYYCDCQEVDFEAAYEGLRCEHRADVYCVSEGVSKHSFCTNGGICMEIVGPDMAHMGCECPDDYDGAFCQFVKGSRPKGYPFVTTQTIGSHGTQQQMSAMDKRTNSGAVAGGVVVGIAIGFIVVGLAVYLIPRYRQRYFESVATSEEDLLGPPIDNADGRDLCIEADGGDVLERVLARNSDRKGYSKNDLSPATIANLNIT